jgi:hypothetical protein
MRPFPLPLVRSARRQARFLTRLRDTGRQRRPKEGLYGLVGYLTVMSMDMLG